MKNFYRRLTLTVSTCGILVGCAGGPQVAQEDANAAKASRSFMEDVVLVPASEKLSENAPCALPPEAQKTDVKPQPGQTTGPSKDWKKLVAHANACVKNRNWRTLETLANAIARTDMDSPWGAYFLALSAEGTGELGRALWMIELAQKKAGGRSALFMYQKGRLFFQMKDTAKAMKEIEKAVALDPGMAEGHLFLGDIHRRDQQAAQAQACYLAAMKADPKNERAIAALQEMNVLPKPQPQATTAQTALPAAKK